MEKSSNKTLISACYGENEERIPCWFMRQAGRYLPEYRQLRSQYSFLDLCQTPTAAAEVTLQPLRRYDLDAAIIFSDILIPAVAMGQGLTFDTGHGPQLNPPLRSREDLENLRSPDAARDTRYVGDALALTKKSLKPTQTLIGFAGAPFTVATYMVEGKGTKTFSEIKRMMFAEPSLFQDILAKIGEVTLDYLKMQVAHGADALMLFDTWAGQMPSTDYRQYVFPHVKSLFDELQSCHVPLIYYPGQGSDNLYELRGLAADVIAVDWRTPIDRAIRIIRSAGLDITVQGNLDPQILMGSKELVQQRVRDILERIKKEKPRGYIFNVGHGLQPQTPPESINWVLDVLRFKS